MSSAICHKGLPSGVERKDLFKLVKQNGPSLGIKHSALSVLLHLINSVRAEDLETSGLAGVWEQDETIAEKTGLSKRTVKRALKTLADKKFIISEGTHRCGARETSGQKRIAYFKGIDLAPFVNDKVPELIEISVKREKEKHLFKNYVLTYASYGKTFVLARI